MRLLLFLYPLIFSQGIEREQAFTTFSEAFWSSVKKNWTKIFFNRNPLWELRKKYLKLTLWSFVPLIHEYTFTSFIKCFNKTFRSFVGFFKLFLISISIISKAIFSFDLVSFMYAIVCGYRWYSSISAADKRSSNLSSWQCNSSICGDIIL